MTIKTIPKASDAEYQKFFEEWKEMDASFGGDHLKIGGNLMMYEWEKRLMQEFARVVTHNNGDVLEIGFGMGVSATCIQEFGAKSHTIIEPHPTVYEQALEWKKKYDSEIILLNDFWQNQTDKLSLYDGIFYDSFSPPQFIEKDIFHFFKLSSEILLKEGGRLSFWYNRSDTLESTFQRVLLENFNVLQISTVKDLNLSDDCKNWECGPNMIVPVVIK